jgi:hypothetical protein
MFRTFLETLGVQYVRSCGQPTETLEVITYGLAAVCYLHAGPAKHVHHIQLTAAALEALLPRKAAPFAVDSIHMPRNVPYLAMQVRS